MYSGYNSTEAFNDRRLVDIARLVPTGPQSGQTDTLQQDEGQQRDAALQIDDTLLPAQDTLLPGEDESSSLTLLNTAVCEMETPTTTGGSTSSDDKVPADDQLPANDQVPAYDRPR